MLSSLFICPFADVSVNQSAHHSVPLSVTTLVNISPLNSNKLLMCVSVFSGSEEAKIRVYTCGSWTLHHRGLYHGSDLSLPNGLALGVGIHPRVNTTPLTLPPLSIFYLITSFMLPLLYVSDRQKLFQFQLLGRAGRRVILKATV